MYYLFIVLVMKALTIRSIETESHPQTKELFWYLFVATRGGATRARIITQLRNKPSNKNQLSQILGLDYKVIEHHMKTLEETNVVKKIGPKYGAMYFVSPLFEESQTIFDEIVSKLKKIGGTEWLR